MPLCLPPASTTEIINILILKPLLMTKDANLDALVSLSDDPSSVYSDFCAQFKSILDLHAPLKSKTLWGNQAPLMSKDLSKAIVTRSRLKNKFNRQKTTANWKAYTPQRNKCVQLRKKAIKVTFQKVWILVI